METNRYPGYISIGVQQFEGRDAAAQALCFAQELWKKPNGQSFHLVFENCPGGKQVRILNADPAYNSTYDISLR